MTRACVTCGRDFEPYRGRDTACSPKCRAERDKRRKRELRAGAPRHPKVRSAYSLPDRTPEHMLGPALPLDGLTDAERAKRRAEHILEVVRQGVPVWAVAERFEMTTDAVAALASRHGVRTTAGRLPYGDPAP